MTFEPETFTLESSEGTPEITFIADDNTVATVNLTENNVIMYDPNAFTITADPGNLDTIIIVVDEEETTIEPGEALIMITVEIDIKPDSDSNHINLASEGVIIVVILSTEDFDATTVNPVSVKFGPGEAGESHWIGHLEDVNNDGSLDMVLHFKIQETGLIGDETNLCLTGETTDGMQFKGCDTVLM